MSTEPGTPPSDLASQAREFIDDPANQLEHQEDPRRLVEQLARGGLLRACVPASYGGLRDRVSLRDLIALRGLLGYRSALADTMFAMQGLGSYPVTLAGSDAQRAALLPRAAAGTTICAFALTEPEAGSDVSAISTTAKRGPDGYRVEGVKCFISNAGLAHTYVLFARTGEDRHQGLTAFVVPHDTPGLVVEPIKLIAPHPIGTLRLAGCALPLSARLGEEGGGFKLAMATLDLFRASVGAAAVGMAARALDEAVRHVRARRQFGRALADFQATKLVVAEMALEVRAARLLVEAAAERADAGEAASIDAAMAKLFATEAAQRVVDRAVQLHGGQGVVAGHIVERLYREVRALRIYEGTSEIQKLVIAKALLRR